MFGAPSGASLTGGKSGRESTANVVILTFGSCHSGSGRWWRSKRSGNSSAGLPAWSAATTAGVIARCG